MTRETLNKVYAPLEKFLNKATSDLWWSLDRFMENAGDSNARAIYSSCRRSDRVKAWESVLLKCKRYGLDTPEAVIEKMEDLIGMRIIAPNKKDAESLFDFLRNKKDSWFCEVVEEPKFTPYTFAEKNGHSLRTGYQAFHITFFYKRSYRPGTEVDKWPVEIQITSQLWAFFAEYSRVYFYSASGEDVEKLKPYAVAVARELDIAEDLVLTTTNLLLGGSGTGPKQGESNEAVEGLGAR